MATPRIAYKAQMTMIRRRLEETEMVLRAVKSQYFNEGEMEAPQAINDALVHLAKAIGATLRADDV